MYTILGIPDLWVSMSIILSVLATIICVLYGILGWNRGDDTESSDEIKKWVSDNDEIEDEF